MALENKLGIEISADLAREEERISKKKAVELFESGLIDRLEAGKFSTLAQIHKYLFCDIYDFAGEIRTVNMAKGNFRFAPLMYLDAALQNIDKMPETTFDEIVEKYVEMNIRTARYSDNGSRTEFILNGSQILAEVSEDSVIAYIYDANGSPIGMQHRLTTYAEDVWDIFWFDKNLQGDIVAVYNEYGVKCISYAYDAWGNSRVTTHDETGTNKYAIKNSFRYRGYYYDRTISMYYLNSRYYDPITCRFINADSYASTGQGLIGHNMFAYCGNNPVMRVDPTGEAWYNDLYDWINTIVGLQNPMSKITLIGAIVVAMIQGNWSGLAHDINSGALDPFNDDEKIALESQVVGFYKGETVIRHSIPNTSSAQILGTIFLNNSEGYNPDGIDTLNHEWGHGVQERLLGTGAYLLFVGVPSAYYCYNGGYLSAPYPLDEKMYYSKIWERTADCFGGVNRNNYFDFWYKDNFIFWQ